MSENILNLLAVEGVQGAGKSKLLDLFEATACGKRVKLITSLERPRAFIQNDYGGGLSLITDLMWFSSAIQNYYEAPSPFPILLDRFLVSQWVYASLRYRLSLYHPTALALKDSISHFVNNLMPGIDLNYRQRTYIDESIEQVNLLYLFLCPSIKQITIQREQSGKDYNYPIVDELKLYKDAFGILDDMSEISCIFLTGTESLFEMMEKINATLLPLSS